MDSTGQPIALSGPIGYPPMFAGCAGMAMLGLAGTWVRVGATPPAVPPAEETLIG